MRPARTPYPGDEHILLGILGHAQNLPARMLTARRLELATVREELAHFASDSGPVAPDGVTILRELGVDVERLRGRLENAFG